MRSSKFKPVLVTWHDAWESQSDVEPDKIRHEPKVQYTVGFLIRKDKRGVTLATEYGDDDLELRTTNFIPKGMIVSITKLVPAKRRK